MQGHSFVKSNKLELQTTVFWWQTWSRNWWMAGVPSSGTVADLLSYWQTSNRELMQWHIMVRQSLVHSLTSCQTCQCKKLRVVLVIFPKRGVAKFPGTRATFSEGVVGLSSFQAVEVILSVSCVYVYYDREDPYCHDTWGCEYLIVLLLGKSDGWVPDSGCSWAVRRSSDAVTGWMVQCPHWYL